MPRNENVALSTCKWSHQNRVGSITQRMPPKVSEPLVEVLHAGHNRVSHWPAHLLRSPYSTPQPLRLWTRLRGSRSRAPYTRSSSNNTSINTKQWLDTALLPGTMRSYSRNDWAPKWFRIHTHKSITKTVPKFHSKKAWHKCRT